jgi:hypothetical protein
MERQIGGYNRRILFTRLLGSRDLPLLQENIPCNSANRIWTEENGWFLQLRVLHKIL